MLVRNGLDEIVLATHLFRPVRFLGYLAPWHRIVRKTPRAVRICKALEDLGPIFVKFGQILSTRKDLLPEDIATELARLQRLLGMTRTAGAAAEDSDDAEGGQEEPASTHAAAFQDPLGGASGGGGGQTALEPAGYQGQKAHPTPGGRFLTELSRSPGYRVRREYRVRLL